MDMEKENKTMLQAVDEINKAAKGASLDHQFVIDMHDAEKIISDKPGIYDTQRIQNSENIIVLTL